MNATKEEADRKRLAEEAEAKRLSERQAEEARQAELRKGDDEKFADIAQYLKGLSGRYTFRSRAGRAKIARVQDVINQAIAILEG